MGKLTTTLFGGSRGPGQYARGARSPIAPWGGSCSDEVFRFRLDTCLACDRYDREQHKCRAMHNRCVKHRRAASYCPEGKWPAVVEKD